MKWVTEMPTEQGWYGWRREPGREQWVWVSQMFGKLYYEIAGVDCNSEDTAELGGEWTDQPFDWNSISAQADISLCPYCGQFPCAQLIGCEPYWTDDDAK